MPRAVAITVAAILIACSGPDRQARPPTEDGPVGPVALTVNYPLAYLAQRIAGDAVAVRFPAPVEVDPAFWQPDDEIVGAYQSAHLVLLNGAGYAKWLDVVTLPGSRLVDTSASFRDRYLTVEGTVTHSHGPQGEHSHEGTAFTTWLDPQLAIEHTLAIESALSERWPEHEQDFRARMNSVEADLLGLHAALSAATARAGSRPIVASHPVYQYLAAAYDLNVRSVQWEPDELPSASQWSDFQRLLREHPASLMLWESEPLPETSEYLDSLGVTVVVFDPAANVPPEGDFLSVMRRNVESLADALAGE